MKRNYKNRVLSLILTVIMVLGMFPGLTYADELSSQEGAIATVASLSDEQEQNQGNAAEAMVTEVTETEISGTTDAGADVSPAEAEPADSLDVDVEPADSTDVADAAPLDSLGDAKAVSNEDKSNEAEPAAESSQELLQAAELLVPAEDPQIINLIDIGAITTSVFEVKPAGSNWMTAPFPDGTIVHVGDQVHIRFDYTKLEGVTPNNIYYFDIPEGLSALTGSSRGDINDGGRIGSYWVEDGKVKLQFDNEAYLEGTNGEITDGFVNFYATLNQTAVDKNGVISIGNQYIGTVPIVEDEDITNVTVDKMNGDGSVDGSGLVYDAEKGAVQYTFEVTADGNNNKTIDSIDVTDTLTTTINGVEDTSVVTGDYTDITITPASSATFTKKNGKYVLHADNVKAGDTIKVTYWVPVKDGIVQAHFTNDVDATKKVGGTESVAGSDSVQGKINNTLQINKSAENPVYHVDEATKTTTVTYKVRVTAPASNTTDIANAYVEDIYELGGDLVTGISGFSTTSENVSYNNDFNTDTKPKFTVELGTMKPGETKEFTYTAVLDTDKCYMQNSNSDRWLDNYAYAKSGDFTFDKSKGSRSFKKEFTKKTGIYDPISGAYKFTVVFNGVLPDTPENADLTDPKYYYNGVLDFLDDEIQTKGKGFHYVGTPAPILEAYRGPEGSDALLTAQLDGNSIDGQESFHLAVPQNMKGAYSYRLTYYVNLPADAQQTDVVTNQYSVTLIGVGNGGSDQTFNSSASVSSAAAGSIALNKSLSNADGDREVLETETGHESEYATQMYTVKISSPIVANATLEDTVTDGDIFEIDFPSDYLQQNLVIKRGNIVFVNGIDYKLESIDNKSFKVTFLKEVTDVSTSNPVTVTYKGQLKVTDAGKEFAETPNNVNNLNPSAIKNSATLNNGNLGPVTKSVNLEPTGKIVKKAANAQELGGAGNELAWDIKPSFDWVYCAFGLGYHNLVDTIPADQELVKVEHFTDNDTPQPCPEGADNDHGYDVVENADGTTTVTIRASAGRCNHHETYRIWTRIKDSALIANNIDPDNFEDLPFTNSAYYEAAGAKWNVSADTTVSRKNNDKTYTYDGGTQQDGGVRFTLTINKDGLEMDPVDGKITVHDTMNRALTLKKETLLLNGKPIGEIPGASLEYDEGSNQFTLELPDKTPFVITYLAEVDAEVGETGWLSNEAYVEERYGTVTTENEEESRLDVSAGSSSALSFYLKKVDKDGNMLTGGKFQLRKVTLEDGQLTETPVTTASNADGMFYDFGDGTYKFRGVTKGAVYALEEIEAPTGCARDTNIYYMYFGSADEAVKTALEAEDKTVEMKRTGGATNTDSMFSIVNNDATIDIPVTKKWDDKNDLDQLRPSSITVKLKADGTVIDTKVLTATQNAVEGQDNTWSYTFTDLPTHKTVDGTTRTAIVYEIEEEAVENYDTPVIVKDQTGNGYTITNTHQAITPAEQEFTGTKTLMEGTTPLTITEGQFKFTVEADAGNPDTIEGLPTGEISVGADGTFSLGTLKFKKAGTYKFTVSEVNGGVAGYTYDNKPVTVTVPVTLDTTDNTLVIGTVTYQKDSQPATGIEFKNTYTTPSGATQVFNGVKTLKENNVAKTITAGQFKFTVAAGDGNPAAIGGLPTGEISVLADGTFSLGTLTFPQAGTYTFTVSEVNGGATGYTYDANPVKVTVPVTLNAASNTLEIGTVTYEKNSQGVNGIEFENTYTTPGGADKTFTGSKSLKENGNDKDIAAGQFKFVAQEDENNPAAITGFPEGEMSVNADGTFSLGTLGFTKAGEYKFTVSEVNGGAAGYVYDDKAVNVTVPVTLDTATNTLVIGDVKYEKNGDEKTGIEFANTYTTPEGASKIFTGEKLLTENGGDKTITAGQFKFTVEAGEGNPAAIGGLPEGEISVLADGTFSLGTLSFPQAGTYTFTVSEVNGGAAGYSYDDKPVKVTVPVTLNTEDNTLVIGDVTYEKGGQEAEGISFENTYTTPDPIEHGFAGTKTLKENGEDKAIKDGQFKFVIQAGENNPARVDLPTEAIPVREDGSFEIGNLSFAKAGTYTFIVSEENGGAAGYTYDDKAVTVTVRVDLNEADNTLSVAEINYSKDGVVDTGITFNNTYTTPDPANAVVTGNKKLTENGAAKAVKAGQFKFTVASGENNPADITGLPTGEIAVNADGTFSLGTLSFTKAGDYSFNVSEVNGGEKGYTYDDKPVTVGISVELNEETNKLEVAQMVYIKDGKGVSGIEFINTYTPDPVKPSQPSGGKTTGGKSTGSRGGSAPKTGDASRVILWVLLLAMSGAGITGLYIRRRRNDAQNK